MARGGDRPDAKVSDGQNNVVIEELVVRGEHRCIGSGDGNIDTGFAHRRDCLNVIVVSVGLEDGIHPESLGELEKVLMFIGSVNQDGIAAAKTAHDVDVVFERSNDSLVNLATGIPVNDLFAQHAPRLAQLWRDGRQRCFRWSRELSL